MLRTSRQAIRLQILPCVFAAYVLQRLRNDTNLRATRERGYLRPQELSPQDLSHAFRKIVKTIAIMSVERGGIQFIYLHKQDNSKVASAESQRRAHAHATKTAHARARRQRIFQLQAARSTEAQVAAEFTLIDSLGSARRDPFASFARRLSPAEDFLLDYCK